MKYTTKTKSFKIRRLKCKWKKFRFCLCRWEKLSKTFTKEKLSLFVKSFKIWFHRTVVQLRELRQVKKEKPHPLEGVKMKYEAIPLKKSKVASSKE